MTDLTSTTDPYDQYATHPCGCPGSSGSDIAVIVTAHNSAAYLAECLESILSQSLPPEKIVVVDDHSKGDNTLAVAHAFEQHGVTVLRTPKNLGMCGARMHGLAETNSPVIMFFDGDDVMPTGYLETMRSELGNHGFVYPGRQFFGSRNDRIAAPAADRARLWRQNYCPSPSLMWRHVFESIGGWQIANPEGTLPDWDLFLRMSRISSFAPSRMDVLVRKHDTNFSGQHFPRQLSEIYGDTRAHAATITVGVVYSGRMSHGFFVRWMAHSGRSINAAGKKAQLLIIDDSADGLEGFGGRDTSIIRIERDRSKKMTPHEVSRFLAGCYNRLKRESTGDLLWLIEDDMLVPVNACQDLMNTLLRSPGAPVAAACGCYRSRHHPDRFVLSSFDGMSVVHSKSPPARPTPVQLTGTGCLMMNRDLVKDVDFEPQWRCNGIVSNAHDWTFSSKLFDQGRPVIALPSVVCPHFRSEDAFV